MIQAREGLKPFLQDLLAFPMPAYLLERGKLGIMDGLILLAVGIETIEKIIEDFDQIIKSLIR